MPRFLLRWFINAVALYAAVQWVSGIHPQSNHWYAYLWLALIFGIVNAIVRPILKLLTFPLVLSTLGLFIWVINAAMFAFAGWIGAHFGVGFTVDNFWAALWGSLITAVVALTLDKLLDNDKDRKSRRRREKK